MITISKITSPVYWSAIGADGSVVASGRLEPGGQLQSGQPNIIYDSDVNAYVGELNAASPTTPPLPAEGTELPVDAVYTWGTDKVVVRQAHTRTHHDPDTVPALFSVWREDYEGMEWVPNEQVIIADRRLFDGTNYECIQAHTTQASWTPPTTPAMWSVVTDGLQPWVQPTGAHDAYQIGEQATHKGNTWESEVADNVWEPGVYGWVVAPA